MTYGESKRMVKFEYNQKNSNISFNRQYGCIPIETLLYIKDMDIDILKNKKLDYIEILKYVFDKNSSSENSPPLVIKNSGPKVLGGGLHDIYSSCMKLCNIREYKSLEIHNILDKNQNLNKKNKFLNKIEQNFTNNKPLIFKFEDENNKKQKVDNINKIPKVCFDINTNIDEKLKLIFKNSNCSTNISISNDPIYYSEKPKLIDYKNLYKFDENEQNRYNNDFYYDMDDNDISFLLLLNIKRLIDWNKNGYRFFNDEDTEKKLNNILNGNNSSSWNYFIDNLMIPGIISENLPQNCHSDVTKLLINGLTFETLIENFERYSKYQSKNSMGEIVKNNSNNQESYCEICNDEECNVGNVIVYCDMCNIGVHQECYGIPYIPDGAWICQRCIASPSNTIKCFVCPNTFGVMKQTENQQWCHMICALWISDITFSNSVFLEPIDTCNLVQDRFKLVCYLCNNKHGACIQCMHNSCYLAMHVSCAQAYGLLVFQVSKKLDTNGNVIEIVPKFKCYCQDHFYRVLKNNLSYTVFDEKKNIETRYIISKYNKKNILLDNCNNDTLKPIIQISIVDSEKLDEISQQLLLYQNKQLVDEIYQYWLLCRFLRGGVPLVRGLVLRTSTNAQINFESSSTLNNSLNVSNKLVNSNKQQKLIEKYENTTNQLNLTKSILNGFKKINVLLSFEIVINNIYKMFVDLIQLVSKGFSNEQIVVKTHNIRAYMIRNLTVLDSKCPSYLRNIIFPLHLFDQLYNFTMIYLEKLYEFTDDFDYLHVDIKKKYCTMFKSFRLILKNKIPIGLFQNDFVDLFKQQLVLRNYTMSHDILVDINQEKLLNESFLIKSFETKKNNLRQKKRLKLEDDTLKVDVKKSKLLKKVDNKSKQEKSKNGEIAILDISKRITRNSIKNLLNESFEYKTNNIIKDNKKHNVGNKNIKNNQRLTRKNQESLSNDLNSTINVNTDSLLIKESKSLNTTNKLKKSLINGKNDKTPYFTRNSKMLPKLGPIKNLNLLKKLKTNNNNSDQTIAKKMNTNKNKSLLKKSKLETIKKEEINTSSKKGREKILLNDSNTLMIKNIEEEEIDESENEDKEDEDYVEKNNMIELKSKDKNNTKIKIANSRIKYVKSSGIYYEKKIPYDKIKNPKEYPEKLNDYSVVWAKVIGYPEYPGIIIPINITNANLEKYGINGKILKSIQNYMKKHKTNIKNKKCYLVVFFDNMNSFQIINRHHIEPFGVDQQLDKISVEKYFTKTNNIDLINEFCNAYNLAFKNV